MSDTWKYLFRPVILERGRDCYYGGDIDQIEKTSDGWRAVAHGTRDYRVSVKYDGRTVTGMSCTCPYAEDGQNCKHMAALLYAADEKDFSDGEDSIPEETPEEILAKMSEDDLRKELEEIMREDKRVRDRIVSRYRSSPSGRRDIEYIISELNGMAYEYGDRYGFIDWQSGSEYVNGFCGLLDDVLPPMIARKEYSIVFEILKEAFHILNEVEMDGSGGEHGDIAYTIVRYWDQIIHLTSEEERERMHDWFADMQEISEKLLCGDSIDYVLENCFDDEKYIMPKLEETREELNGDIGQMPEYRLETLLEKYESLLRRSGKDTGEYEAWLQDHQDLKVVKSIRLEQKKEQNDASGAARLLEELYEMTEDSWEKSGYLRELIDIYEDLKETEKRKDALRRYLFVHGVESFTHLFAYKELCGKEEWETAREAYLEKHPRLKPAVYQEEGLFDQLILCLKDQEIDVVNEYRDPLEKMYPAEMRMIYLKYLTRLENRHPNNATYREMERYLLITAGIPDSVQAVCSLMDEWERSYPTRKGMLKMLANVRKLITV